MYGSTPQEMFGRFDASGDGEMDQKEFVAFVRDGLGFSVEDLSDDEISSLMNALDLGGDGGVGADDVADFMASDFSEAEDVPRFLRGR